MKLRQEKSMTGRRGHLERQPDVKCPGTSIKDGLLDKKTAITEKCNIPSGLQIKQHNEFSSYQGHNINLSPSVALLIYTSF